MKIPPDPKYQNVRVLAVRVCIDLFHNKGAVLRKQWSGKAIRIYSIQGKQLYYILQPYFDHCFFKTAPCCCIFFGFSAEQLDSFDSFASRTPVV